MECPKCGLKIDDNTLVCPNCKKVLKLVCPICKTINKTNTCHKCGYIIVNKCHSCGKINPTIAGKCSRCGFDTNVSAILQGSNIDEFACLTIDFPNISDMKAILGSKQLYEKFREKLNGLIYDYVTSIGLKRGVFGDTFIIRFNKDYTYASSVKNALNSAIAILNLVTQLNYKLTKAKDTQLKCNVAILKRNAYASNDDYKSGININLLYQNIGKNKLLGNLQLIADGSVYEIVGDQYPMNAIGMTRVKNQSLLLYELDLKDYIKLVEDEDDSPDSNADIKIPDIIEAQKEVLESEDTIYDIDGISFDEINCNFTKEYTQGLSSHITQQLMSKLKNIIVVKGKKEYTPRTAEIIDKIKQNKIYQHVYRVTCYDEMKYKPYGFFYDLLSGMYGFSSTGKLKAQNDFSAIKTLDSSGFLEDAINLKAREFPHPEDVRYGLFEIFEKIMAKMQKNLIIIENIEKIDDTSFELLQKIFQNFCLYNVSFLIFADKTFSLHKSAHFLLSSVEYTEITLKPTPIKMLIEANAGLCKNILNTFYMQKISKNTKGSQMYFMQAIVHLIDLGIFVIENGSLEMAKSETFVFPTTLDELIQKRLLFIKSNDENLFRLFVAILLIGPQIDLPTIKFYNHKNLDEYLTYLDNKGFIYNANGVIQVQNYNLYYENALKILSYEERRAIANYLVSYFFKENTAHPILAKLYSMVESSKNEFVQWENLSNINRSLGDFSAYLNCSLRFLKLLSNNINESSSKSIEDYKLEVYENIANLLYKYTPEKIANITQVILDNLENGMNDKKVVNLCNKIMQGCLISGNYTHALLMSHKILSRMEKSDLNPQSPDFGVNALLISLIKIEILFNVGDLEDCIELGDEIFRNLVQTTIEQIKPNTISTKQFTDLIIDAAGYVIFAKILQLKTDTFQFCELVEKIVPDLPESYKLFVDLEKLIHNKLVNIDVNRQINEHEKFDKVLYFIIDAFLNYKQDPNGFAIKIYHAKLGAKANNLNQLELFCDLMIGRSYFLLDKYNKASTIYNSVLETAQNNGLKNIYYLSAYFTAELSVKNNDIETAYGIIANTIVKLEQNRNTSAFILMMFKSMYAKILKLRKEDTQASFCYNQAKQLSEIHKITLI